MQESIPASKSEEGKRERLQGADVATLLWPSVGVKPNTWKSWDLESSGFREKYETLYI